MKTNPIGSRSAKIRQTGLTRQDALGLVAIAIIGILSMGIFVANRGRMNSQSRRVGCISNLKQIGLAFRMRSGDQSDTFPFIRNASDGGTREAVSSGQTFRHFIAISNDLNTPKVLTCPSDVNRRRTLNWSEFGPTNLSYFVGVLADESKPNTLLSGDRNIVGGKNVGANTLEFEKPIADWNDQMHHFEGNIGLGDGSAHQVTSEILRKWLLADRMCHPDKPTRLQMP